MNSLGPRKRFVLNIDIKTMEVTGWPKPIRHGSLVVAVSGVVVEGGRPSPQGNRAITSAYVRYGATFTAEILGQFCAVVVDVDARKVVLTQDSFGVRDLFYLQDGSRLIVASDLDLVVATQPDLGLNETFFAQFIGTKNPDRKLTPFEGVQRLTHGWTMVFSEDGISRFRAWTPPERAENPALCPDPEERLRELIGEAVVSSLPNEGTVVCELTGGLDSSSIFTTAHPLYDQLHALTYVADRGLVGDDELFAAEVLKKYEAPWNRLDLDTTDFLPEDFGGFIAEPRAILYIHQFIEIERCLRDDAADVLLTGALGDVIFDYSGITPAFLADPLARGAILSAYRLARDWAAARDDMRAWSHYLLQIGWPIAWRHLRGRSVLDYQKDHIPAWVSLNLIDRCKPAYAEPDQIAPRVVEPGRQHLWESVYDLASHENCALFRRLSADIRHPLYYRPLVEFLLGLD
ncbi:MAG: asparagine synthase-related protein, partial [Arenicellales bacterium]